ncbi:hypothetical protein MARPO_0170s0002 [Marchantia polymorpha]|uniref:Uncharacterized protein n=1 Tax=Marchantia polymorpha TaxID=3197 RepID=A0A2R6W2W2_MARPO|nr:hypothetical protein MARPO_0170s0002 [Marchantia polymorpha]|eukprot:PTQ28194.1 hypothetical protein MARPO_0170s0002 [Marchantia polymorpha]
MHEGRECAVARYGGPRDDRSAWTYSATITMSPLGRNIAIKSTSLRNAACDERSMTTSIDRPASRIGGLV